MSIKYETTESSIPLNNYMNLYVFIGLSIGLCSILIASLIVSHQLTGSVNLNGLVQAQLTSPIIWILDLTPFILSFWGHSLSKESNNKTEPSLYNDRRDFFNKSGDLEFKLKYESQHDDLTHLPNSRLFSEQLSQTMKQLNHGNELGLIILRINDFKNIQSNFGNFNANSVLKKFSNKLTEMLNEPFIKLATTGINYLARLENDEFAIILTLLNQNLDLNELLSSIIKSTTTSVMVDGINVNLTTTAAIALYPQHADTDFSLINHARNAVYYARKEGNPFAIYNTNMHQDNTSNRILINELKRSIENNELEIYYQPTVELATGTIIGAEALVRFEHEKSGLINAEQFVHLIEGSNLIHQLTSFLLIRVIKQLALWHQENHKIFVSVNLSAKDAIDRELPAFIEKLLLENEIAPEYLKLEFTEQACLSDQAKSIEVLYQLSNLGVKISIDDFCSGYSSFVYLTNLPIDEIKIEKSLILNMNKDKKKAQIVEAILKLAQTLKLNVCADGVADKTILSQLQELGCLYGQGFHFSRAVTHKEFKALLEK